MARKPHTLRLPQADPYTLPRGLVIVTTYKGWTDTSPPRIVATLRRDADTTYRAVVPCEGLADLREHHRAALACLAKVEVEADNSAFGFSFTLAGVGTSREGYHCFTTRKPDRCTVALGEPSATLQRSPAATHPTPHHPREPVPRRRRPR
jgi:hypothetical protein